MSGVTICFRNEQSDQVRQPQAWEAFRSCQQVEIMDRERIDFALKDGYAREDFSEEAGQLIAPSMAPKGYIVVRINHSNEPKGTYCDDCTHAWFGIENVIGGELISEANFAFPISRADGNTFFVRVKDEGVSESGFKEWPKQGKQPTNQFTITWEQDKTAQSLRTLVKWYLDRRQVGEWSFPNLGFGPKIGRNALRMITSTQSSVSVGYCTRG